MYRRKSFDHKLSKKLVKPTLAKRYLMNCVNNKRMSIMDALKHTISCMGTKEFSDMSGIKSPNISRMLSQDVIPKISTLTRFLAPFDLQVTYALETRRTSSKAKKKSKTKKKAKRKYTRR